MSLASSSDRAARAAPFVINLRVRLCARARGRILDRDVPQRHMQIRGDRSDDLFPAEQGDFREAFPRDCRSRGNDARVFALRQHDALRTRTRAGLDFLDQCHPTPKLSQVCAGSARSHSQSFFRSNSSIR